MWVRLQTPHPHVDHIFCEIYPKIWEACSFTLISLGPMMRVMVPVSSAMKVVRNTPMEPLPHIFFSPNTPSSLTKTFSVSQMRGKGRLFFSMNFLWLLASCVLTPITT